jgi:hypothetical protein
MRLIMEQLVHLLLEQPSIADKLKIMPDSIKFLNLILFNYLLFHYFHIGSIIILYHYVIFKCFITTI